MPNQSNNLKNKLQKCANEKDSKVGHYDADDILIQIALDIKLTALEGLELIAIYNKVRKEYG